MAQPNYEFEKRKRDLAKKAAKAAKKQKKLEKGATGPQIIDPNAPETADTETDAAETEPTENAPAAEG